MATDFTSRRMIALLAVVLAVLALSVAACEDGEPEDGAVTATATAAPTATSAPSTEGPSYGGILRRAGAGELPQLSNVRTLDPVYSVNFGEYDPDYLLYNDLVQVMSDSSIGPDLAEDWVISSDGTVITFRIRTGVQFHDGTAFDAQAAKWNIERVKDPEVQASQSSFLAPIEQVEVVDSHSLRLRLSKPWRPVLASLAERAGWMASPTAVLQTNSYSERTGNFGRQPVGTGPFRFKEWRPDDRLTLQRFDGYFEEGKPYLDEIVFQDAGTIENVIAMLRTGQTDWYVLTGLSGVDKLSLLEGNPDLSIHASETGATYSVNMDPTVPPFDNKALRQAINYAFNREALVTSFFGGKARGARQLLAGGWAQNPDLTGYEYDPEKAREKLTEAGYPDGIQLPFPYTCNSSESLDVNFCEAIQAQLGAVGIDMNVDVMTGPDFWTRLFGEKDVPFFHWFWNPRGDPNGRMQLIVASNGFGTQTIHYENSEVDRLIEEAGQLFDRDQAREIYGQIERLLADDSVYAWLLHHNEYVVTSGKVQGFQPYPDLVYRMRDIWLSQ